MKLEICRHKKVKDIGSFIKAAVLRVSQQVSFSAVYLCPESLFYFVKNAQGNICA